MHRKITKEGLDLIKKFESFSSQKYICPAGIPTIGYGHVIKSGENFEKISLEEAEILLKKDLVIAELAVLKLIKVELSDHQFSSLVSFCFNLGGGALQRSAMRQKINRLEHHLVPKEFVRFVYAGGKKLPGLVLRRNEEAAMYARIVKN